MGTAATAAVTSATPVLGEYWNRRESKTGERSKCQEGSEKTESAHNAYLRSKRRTFKRGDDVEGRRAPA
jgi:hypothetical protein